MKFKRLEITKIRVFWIMLLPIIYTTLVLSYVWWQCFTSPWPSGKNGQLDAYRHTLASAVVAYTSSPKVVQWVTHLMEHKGNAANLMDQHNNRIGANTANSLNALNHAVNVQISQGTVNANSTTQTTWLPQTDWGESLLW